MKTIETTQATMSFNHDLDQIGNVEVKATWFIGRVTINSVRLNSTYAFVALTESQSREIGRMARWYFEDKIA